MRYVRIPNLSKVDGKFSLMDMRVFGKDRRGRLGQVTGFDVSRNQDDHRMFTFSWNTMGTADGYILRCGLDKNHLTHAVTVEGNSYHARYFN